MNYIRQFGIILAVSCLGELLKMLLPFAIPTTIYGLVLMLVFLHCKIIKLESVKVVGDFLISIMPVLFIPATVGLIATWEQLQGILIPFFVIIVISTLVIMVVSGKVTDVILSKGKVVDAHDDESDLC